MKKFKITFLKVNKLALPDKGQPITMAEQEVLCDNNVFDIDVPAGYCIASVIEILPTKIINPGDGTAHIPFDNRLRRKDEN